MNRQEFIQDLRRELRKLPPEEIVAATEYFEEYFDEEGLKGEKSEEEIVKGLGSPKRIATEVKADYAARILDEDGTAKDGVSAEKKPSAGKKISAAWWLIIGACSVPVSIPLALGIGAIAICVFFTLLATMIGIYCAIIGSGVGAIGLVVAGILAFAAGSASTGFMFLGAGFLIAGLTAAAGVGAFIGTRELIRLIVRWGRSMHEKQKKRKLEKMSKGGEGNE